MNYAKEIVSFADYGLTIAEATGYKQPSPIEKYSVVSSKLLLSATQDSDIDALKEIGQAGISVLCGMGGYVTGDRKTAARLELVGKVLLDIAAMMAKK